MKTKDAMNKMCPFVQHAAIVSNNLIIDEEQLNDRYNAPNILCNTTSCMAWVETNKEEQNFTGYCSLMGEPDDVIIGVNKGALDKENMDKFLKGKPFEFNGNKEQFITIKKRNIEV